METFDVAIVGGGPAGSSCAAFCALAGLDTLVLERENFPREKVCGDCLNPSCWSVLERLGLQQQVRNLPHSKLDSVAFIAIDECDRVKLGMRQIPDLLLETEAFEHRPTRRIQTVAAHFFAGKIFPLKNERIQTSQRTKCRTARSGRAAAHYCDIKRFHFRLHRNAQRSTLNSQRPVTTGVRFNTGAD